MPVKTWDTKADFDAVYNVGLEPQGHPSTRAEIRGNYERSAIFNASVPYLDFVTPFVNNLIAHFAWPTTHSILIAGCGFGWTVEAFRAAGYDATWGVDTSAYIQAEKDNTDSRNGLKHSADGTRVRNDNMGVRAQRNRLLRDTVGQNEFYDVVLTEFVISSWTDAEAQSNLAFVRDDIVNPVGGMMLHAENDSEPPVGGLDGFNVHTLENWKLLLPLDSFTNQPATRFI